MKQVRCLAFAVIVFCLTIVACDVSVSFLNACYVGFGPVFFCTYEECKALINLSGSPQGHPLFDIIATPCGMHVAHGHSTHAEAFTLLKFYRRTHTGIHSAAIMPSHSSIIRSTRPSSCSQYLRAHRQGPMQALSYPRALLCTHGRAPEFLNLQSAHRRAALSERARGPACRRIRMRPERTLC